MSINHKEPEHLSLLRNSLRQFIEKEMPRDKVNDWDKNDHFPQDVYEKLCALGVTSLTVPEEFGGAGLGYFEYIAVIAEISKVCGSIGLSVAAHNSLCTNHILKFGNEEQKKKLIAGIVLTGGGSQLKHLKQLVEYVTGMDTRVGYPNEHLAGDTDKNVTSPLYATAVGLVMDGLSKIEKNTTENLELENSNEEDGVIESNEEDNSNEKEQRPEKTKIKRESFLDKLTKNLQDFLDNAE